MRQILLSCFITLICGAIQAAAASQGSLVIEVAGETGGPLPCRIHLKGSDGKPVRADGLPFFNDHFVCPGKVQLSLPAGRYQYEIERGPEYEMKAGEVVLGEGKETLSLKLKRIADLRGEGWWPGELHVHRPLEQIELLMRAEDLQVAPVITWWNNRNLWTEREKPANTVVRFDGNRFYDVMGGEDEREGGALLFFHLKSPLPIAGAGREYPSPMEFLLLARKEPDVWIDIEKPFWWDAPVWLASGKVDSIGLANNHMCRSRMYESEAWGKPRDVDRLPNPRGNGYWTQEIYYRILNCGLRIPPSAGSASGVLPNPVGYNRVYVHLGSGFDYRAWWDGLRAGRSFVSNGPLLRCRANGQLPGHIFTAADGESIEIDIESLLTTRDRISSIEIIKNGRIEKAIPFDGSEAKRSLGSLRFTESGWFLVRVIADVSHTFRFASTAPFYVEVGPEKRRVSRRDAQFLVDWINERKARVQLSNAEQRRGVLEFQEEAERFWTQLRDRANAE